VGRLGREFRAASPILAGSTVPPSDVAILNSYPSRWSIEGQRHHAGFDYVEHLVHFYQPFRRRNVAVDVVSPDAPLDGYRVVVTPALTVLDDEQAGRLRTFVEGGGHLVLTVRTAVKDPDNAFRSSRPPGPLAACAGVEVEEYYALLEPIAVEGDGLTGRASVWAERLAILDPDAVRVLARFGPDDDWLSGRPAITARSHGAGRVYYVAAYLDEGAQQVLTDLLLSAANIVPALDAPAEVEANIRVDADGREILILINHGAATRPVDLPWEADDHLAASPVGGRIELAPYGTAVLTRSAAAARLAAPDSPG
jgi:beta-galactosidase